MATTSFYRWRSSVTGRWVTPEYAEQHPDITVREKVTR